MINCPICREEIDDGSHFCDQCGQPLLYCNNCGRVGTGRRCTQCGGLMISADQLKHGIRAVMSSVTGVTHIGNMHNATHADDHRLRVPTIANMSIPQPNHSNGIPTITLINPKLNIRIVGINGAIIGRRQGPYHTIFSQFMYISGVHAQLVYQHDSGWNIIDKHSSNGTKLNNSRLSPDIPVQIKNGDIINLANVSLQANII